MSHEQKHECARGVECVHNNAAAETLIEMHIPSFKVRELMDMGCKVYVKTLRASSRYYFVLVSAEDLSKITR